jgi:uncharacterized protein (TIGR02001 family)
MKKTKLALAALMTLASASVLAQTAAAPAAAPAPTPDWTITGNAGLFSDYRFRGISQTDKKPAFQGGFDIAHSSGFYIGNWNSNIDSAFYTGANVEMDFYTGFKGTVGDTGLGYDIGAIYYYYPGSDRNNAAGIDNKEIYVGASYGPVSAKVYVPIGDFFSAQRNFGGKSAAGSYYIDLSGAYDLANAGAPGFALVAHFGYQDLKGAAKLTDVSSGKLEDSYIDWKLGATYTVSGGPLNGIVFGLSYIDTDIDIVNSAGSPTRKLSGATGVFSISKSF